MKLIKPSYEICTPIDGVAICKSIERASRDCYQSDGKTTDDSYTVLIPKLMNLNHEAMLEFGGMIHVRFIVDRGVSHELVRHRMASFAQESTRYCNYGKDEHISFIIPPWITALEGIYDYAVSNTDSGFVWAKSMLEAEQYYNQLIAWGWTPQQAHSVLPNSLKTTINVSCNIREWRHILRLRTAKTAHPQMREVMQPLLDEFKRLIPILFDDITY